MIQIQVPARKPGQRHVLNLACEPLQIVRIAFIGLGKRGRESILHYLHIDRVEIKAICDLNPSFIDEVKGKLTQNLQTEFDCYTDKEDWKIICERKDIDLIYICTPRDLHCSIACYAMECGKHVAIEVPFANTLEECWQLIDKAEQTRRHCMMLENCCYDELEMAVLNMAQQGKLGEIVHLEGAYIHDLRSLDFDQKSHYLDIWTMQGNPYPTHGFGPLCQLLDIHRSDKLKWLCSVSSAQFGHPYHASYEPSKHSMLGNMNTSIIKTEKEKTIVLQHDITSPRPYSRNYLVSGTKGFVQKRNQIEMSFLNEKELTKEEIDQILIEYQHPLYKDLGEKAKKVGSHGGMDFLMDYRLIHCLQNGLPLDMDVYDGAEWSSIVELSAISVKNGSVPVQIPDFTRSDA